MKEKGLIAKLTKAFAEAKSVNGWLTLLYTVEVRIVEGKVQFLVVPFQGVNDLPRKDGTIAKPVVGSLLPFRAALALAERLNKLDVEA